MQDQKIFVTKRSVNIIKEYRNYLWETDKEGKILNVPEHTFSHSMDAIRYAVVSLKGTRTQAHVHYSYSSMPRNNLDPLADAPKTAPELQPRYAHTHVPNL